MEDNNNVNVILEKKIDGYGTNLDDFVAPRELTVTITLSEYRELIAGQAEDKASAADRERWKAESELKDIKASYNELRDKYHALLERINANSEEEK